MSSTDSDSRTICTRIQSKVKGSKGLGMGELINYFLAFLDHRKKITVKHEVSHQSTTLWIPLDGDPCGLNPDLSVETNDNSIGEKGRCSRSDYNRPGVLHLSNRYTNSCGRHDLVEHDNPATRAPVLQAIEELARTSRTSTEL
jgi:hypothetical protein